MQHGMPERHLWIAGEHTAPFVCCIRLIEPTGPDVDIAQVALGTTTGAYLSGEGVAKRIAAVYDLAPEVQGDERRRTIDE